MMMMRMMIKIRMRMMGMTNRNMIDGQEKCMASISVVDSTTSKNTLDQLKDLELVGSHHYNYYYY